MSVGHIWSVDLVAMEAASVRVETHVSEGISTYTLVGLFDTAVRGVRDQVRAVVPSCFIEWPDMRTVPSPSPAPPPKTGSGYDLAMAMAVLAVMRIVSPVAGDDFVMIGEPGLDGRIILVWGILPSVLRAVKQGKHRFIVPHDNVFEAQLVSGAQVIGAHHLGQVIGLLGGSLLIETSPVPDSIDRAEPVLARKALAGDFADIRGQAAACHAMEIAAAGDHHSLMVDTSGSGKTILASRLPGILSPLSDEQAVAVTAIHSLAGALFSGEGLMWWPPFQAPHHSATLAAVAGGGSGVPRPGAASLVHCGVPFLDEVPESGVRVLDSLREPLENAEITLHRAAGAVVYLASFRLIMAANPCPRGDVGSRRTRCTCTPFARKRYLERSFGPLLDRMDTQIQVETPGRDALCAAQATDTIEIVTRRVTEACRTQAERWQGQGWLLNREIPGSFLRPKSGGFSPETLGMVDVMVERDKLSMRGAQRVLWLAWTAADLEGKTMSGMEHVEVVMTLRQQGAEIGNTGD